MHSACLPLRIDIAMLRNVLCSVLTCLTLICIADLSHYPPYVECSLALLRTHAARTSHQMHRTCTHTHRWIDKRIAAINLFWRWTKRPKNIAYTFFSCRISSTFNGLLRFPAPINRPGMLFNTITNMSRWLWLIDRLNRQCWSHRSQLFFLLFVPCVLHCFSFSSSSFKPISHITFANKFKLT